MKIIMSGAPHAHPSVRWVCSLPASRGDLSIPFLPCRARACATQPPFPPPSDPGKEQGRQGVEATSVQGLLPFCPWTPQRPSGGRACNLIPLVYMRFQGVWDWHSRASGGPLLHFGPTAVLTIRRAASSRGLGPLIRCLPSPVVPHTHSSRPS